MVGTMASRGTLYLIPVPLADSVRGFDTELSVLVARITHWIVETPKVARAQLRLLCPDVDLNSLAMDSWSKHGGNDASALLKACIDGNDMWGRLVWRIPGPKWSPKRTNSESPLYPGPAPLRSYLG